MSFLVGGVQTRSQKKKSKGTSEVVKPIQTIDQNQLKGKALKSQELSEGMKAIQNTNQTKLRDKAYEVQQELETLQSEHDSLEEKYNALQAKSAAASSSDEALQAKQGEIDALQQELQALQHSHAELQKQERDSASALSSTKLLHGENAALKAQLSVKIMELETLAKELEFEKVKNVRLHHELVKLKTRFGISSDDKDPLPPPAKDALKDSKLAILHNEMTTAQELIVSLREQLKAAQDKAGSAAPAAAADSAQVEQLKQQVGSLEADLAQATSAAVASSTEVDQLKQQVGSLEEKLRQAATASSSVQNSLILEIDNWRQQSQEAAVKNSAVVWQLQQEIEILNQQLQNEVKVLQQELAQAQAAAPAAPAAAVDSTEVDRLRNLVAQLEQQVVVMKTENDTLNQNLQEKQKELSDSNKKLTSIQAQNVTTQHDWEKIQHEYIDGMYAQRDLEKAQKKIADLENQLAVLQSAPVSAPQTVDAASATPEVIAQLAKLQADKTALEKRLAASEAVKTDLETRLQVLQATKAVIEQEFQDYKTNHPDAPPAAAEPANPQLDIARQLEESKTANVALEAAKAALEAQLAASKAGKAVVDKELADSKAAKADVDQKLVQLNVKYDKLVTMALHDAVKFNTY